MLRDCVLSTEAAGQMVVVETMSGAASTAAEALDTLEMPEIAGSIAGDNTIFLAVRDHDSAEAVSDRIRELIR
jgi:transcriptional regulator of arginine metabolism